MVWYGMVWYGMVWHGMVWPFFFLFFQSTHKRVCLLKRPQHLTAKVIKLSKNILFLFPLLMKFFLVLDHFTRDTFDTLSSHRIGWIRRTKSKTASIFKTENAKCFFLLKFSVHFFQINSSLAVCVSDNTLATKHFNFYQYWRFTMNWTLNSQEGSNMHSRSICTLKAFLLHLIQK